MADSSGRDIVFVSHANPEDNEFSRWLTLRLGRDGYPVWLDLKRLLGGEDFWADIEQVIRGRAIKFLYVLTRISNTKPGTLKELAVAQSVAKKHKLKDFIIPLHVDQLPYDEINIELHRLNAVPFHDSWAHGYSQLLERLEEDGVVRSSAFTPEVASSWWRSHFNAQTGVVAEPEECLSNWFRLSRLPENVFAYECKGKPPEPEDCEWPSTAILGRCLSFATPEVFGKTFEISECVDFKTKDVIEGVVDERYIPRTEARRRISFLVKDNWLHMLRERALLIYQLSNHRFCGALRQNQTPDDKVHFAGVDGKATWRGVVGYKTMHRPDKSSWVRFWHFAIQVRLQYRPELTLLVTPHVVFSEDGQHPWDSRDRQHGARRSQCRSWWNDDWRDRILAIMRYLAGESDVITVDCGGDSMEVASRPLTFTSPVRYGALEQAVATDPDDRDYAGTETEAVDDPDYDEDD